MVSGWLLSSFLLLSPFQTETGYQITLGLNESIDPYVFGEPSESLLSQLDTIDTSSLGSTSITLTVDDRPTAWTVVVTNASTWVTPKLGYHPLLSYVSVNNEAVLSFDLFNPTIRTMSLSTYRLGVNDTIIPFDSSLTIAPLQALSFTVIEGGISSTIQPSLSWDQDIVSLAIHHPDGEEDQLILPSITQTRYGTVEDSSYHLYRDGKALQKQTDYDALAWMHRPLQEDKRKFELAQPTITPLEQAKRWAEFVMYGDGMLAAGRVEEAFRSIEREYIAMHPSSQQLIFDQPNTKITGINESSQQDTSTFREAVGRYNYLAARVENGQGLTSPTMTTLDFSSIILPSLAVGSVLLLFLFLKQRHRVY